MWRVQLWWGDEWSYGSTYLTKTQANQAASTYRNSGWKVRIIKQG